MRRPGGCRCRNARRQPNWLRLPPVQITLHRSRAARRIACQEQSLCRIEAGDRAPALVRPLPIHCVQPAYRPNVPRLSRLLIRCAVFVALAWLHAPGSTAQADDRAATAAATGIVEGNVTYRADTKKPWRYARYYVKQSRTGELAEAVVALRGEGLEAAQPKPTESVTIDQKNFQFLPETVAIRKGGSVTFTNSDQAVHNVRSTSDLASFNVTMPQGGKGHTVRFDRAGGVRRPIEIGCAYHSSMRAWVFVFDHPFFAVTLADGRFRFAAVPAGKYELELAHPAGSLHWRQRIEVRPSETLHVEIHVSPDNKR